jgi:tripartite-type tricarboxylate transporter receptor subunit TctC
MAFLKKTMFSLVLLLFSSFTFSQDSYPNSVISLVTWAPGGFSDINSRLLAESWQKILNQPIIVINKGGLGGAIGSAQVANAKPDGYSILLALSSVVIAPEAERLSGKKPIYELEQLDPLALISSMPMVMLVSADSPWNNLSEFVKYAKENPGKVFYSSSGTYGPVHLAMEMFAFQAGIQLTTVPFGGGAPALMALLSNQVQMTLIDPRVAIPHITSGKLKALGVSSNKRLITLPDVPTYKEFGYDAEYYLWAGLYLPKGTPKNVTDKLRTSLKEAISSPGFIKGMQSNQILIDYRDTPEFKKYSDDDGQRMIKLIKAIGPIK